MRAGLTQAPDPVILRALRRASGELCRQSHVWREELETFALVSGEKLYELEAPSGARVERIMVLKVDGRLLAQARPQDIFELRETPGTPRCFGFSATTQEVVFSPVPDTNGLAVQVYAALVPMPDSDELPDDVLAEYGPGLIALAKAHLMLTSVGMPYYDPRAAAVHAAIGEEWIVRAKRDQHGGGHTPLRARPRPFV